VGFIGKTALLALFIPGNAANTKTFADDFDWFYGGVNYYRRRRPNRTWRFLLNGNFMSLHAKFTVYYVLTTIKVYQGHKMIATPQVEKGLYWKAAAIPRLGRASRPWRLKAEQPSNLNYHQHAIYIAYNMMNNAVCSVHLIEFM
jgi:hypothetical protein